MAIAFVGKLLLAGLAYFVAGLFVALFDYRFIKAQVVEMGILSGGMSKNVVNVAIFWPAHVWYRVADKVAERRAKKT